MKKMVFYILIFLLIFLFTYTGLSKLLDYRAYVSDMNSQPFPGWLDSILIPSIPAVEILCVVLLSFHPTRSYGLFLSLGLIVLFTLYTVLVLLHVFVRVPCPCGGIIKHLSWRQHLFFNVCFLAIILICLKNIHAWNRDNRKPVEKSR